MTQLDTEMSKLECGVLQNISVVCTLGFMFTSPVNLQALLYKQGSFLFLLASLFMIIDVV